MSDLQKELQEQKEQNINLQAEIRELHAQVRKWSTYCAYVAGSSIGIILFLQIFSSFSEETECGEEQCQDVITCPEPIECEKPTQIIENSNPNIKEVPSMPKQHQPKMDEKTAEIIQEKPTEPSNEESEHNFPMQYTIKSGDNFSIIANRFYKRASLAAWLAKKNNIDPSKLQIGQEITLPEPPN